MGIRGKSSRVLIYSHDSFGLGHLRRCRAIAHSIVAHRPEATVLILSGSPIIGSFGFRNRVDFVRIPGVIKLQNGDYISQALNLATEETVALRAAIVKQTAEAFAPDLVIVDKEPLGLRGEVTGMLETAKARGARLVLGLRDVMDEPALLAPEWERKNVMPALVDLYDEIWVYGLQQICDPLEGIDAPDTVRRKMTYTGYLRREESKIDHPFTSRWDQPFILVTPGGGGDGEHLVDSVLRAYETDRFLPNPALIVTGPFMQSEQLARYVDRASKLDNVEILKFDSHLEDIMAQAAGVVAMGGYNTFCEILSFDKPALLVPRQTPRLEQTIRAERAAALGLVHTLNPVEAASPSKMARAIQALPLQQPPSSSVIPGLMEGLDNVNRLVDRALDTARVTPLRPRQTA